MAGLPSGTVTLLFSDIEGSTGLLRRLGPVYEVLLAEHRSLLRVAFAEAGGDEVETRGDSFLVAFVSARAAVEGAVAAQRALAAHSWPDDVQPRVRMGVHTGEPTRSSEGYVGLDVHRAARIGDAANGGQVLVSESTRSLIGREIVLRDLGEYRLAGLDRPERLYQVVAAGLASEFEAPRAQAQAQRRAQRLRTPDDLTKVGWRVHSLSKLAPPALSRPIQALAGAVLAAARVVSAVDRTLETADRDEYAAQLADYQIRSSAALHVAQAATELEQQLAALDRLPERRRAVEDDISRLDEDLDSLELRLRSAPRAGSAPALGEELADRRDHLTETVRLLEETNAAAPAAPPVPAGRLQRTRRRGIYRAGSVYVVLAADEHGLKRPRVATTIAEALELREALKTARRRAGDSHDRRDPYFPWDNPGL